ncbi:bromodomain-containing protein 4-like isoform X2 [Durio zibethinus]|uniref:Bromodomain-containing protein 4-like isoform X2 n=1 Tax=Durio zibethinus TaxID=66656 RepID=A0A6P5XBT0_DURZI|nr:bromodomain-containing protein 4-like isoform X2 [Durio zibethinus]
MRTKRKRACRKPPAKRSAALAKNEKAVNQSEKAQSQNEKAVSQNEEAFLTFINQNNKEGSVSADSNDLEVVDKHDSDDAKSSSSSSSSSSSDSNESFSAEETKSDDSSSVDRRYRKSTKGHSNGKQKASKLPKKEKKDDVKSSRVLRSSSKKQEEFKMPQHDPRYNKKELKAALEVIKKIMKMDEAQSFNVPVDHVALGKPDYPNVIDTPMDFGTICSNLENSIKYMNSEDVFNDVQYIWENCCKCNKKGEYIVYLMKRVKKKFMKYWTAAGLRIEQSRKINVGILYEPSMTDHATWHSRHEPFYPVGNAVDGASQLQQDHSGFNQHHPFLPPLSYSQPHQLPQPPPSTAWPQFSQLPPVSYHQPCQSQHPQPSTNQPQFSQLQACTGCNSAGNSHFQPPNDIASKHKKHASSLKHKKNASMAPAASICGGAPSHTHLQQPQLSHKQPYGLQQQSGISQLQPSQLHAVADGGYSHFQPPVDITPKNKKHASKSKHKKNPSMGPTASIYGGPPSHSHSQQPQLSYKLPYGLPQHQQSISQLQPSQLHAVADGDYTRSSGYVPWYPVDPMVVGPGQSHPQQSPLSNGESSEPQQPQPQASRCQPQSSQLQENVDIEPSHMSLTDSALKGIRCALKYSSGPTTNKSIQENQAQSGPIELQPEQTPQRQLPKKKKKGRGPTRCLFLNDLADGERIVVCFNNLGQPIGPESSKLSSFLGTIARNGHRAPLNFVHWRAMPDSYKEEMWEYVQTKFDLDPSGKSWVMQSLGTKWRDWKADLKAAYYDSLETDEERLKVQDPRVVPDQWPSLISYWNSDDTKKRCATNRANRLKQKGSHSSGTKSYARIREEEQNKRPDGKEPTRAELYILTHTRKNGQPVDETAAEFILKIREQEANKRITLQCSDESNDTLCQVMGAEKHNRVRTYGLGPTRADVFGPRPSRDDLVMIASEAKKSANEEVRKMVVKMEAMEEKYARMETHIARMTSNMEKFLEKIGGSSNILGFEQFHDTPKSPE